MLLPLLIMPQVYAASYLATSGSTTTGAYVGDLGGLCDSQVNGKIYINAGGTSQPIQLPFIPTISCLSDTSAYAVPPVCGQIVVNGVTLTSQTPCPVFPPPFVCDAQWYNPLTWGGIIGCITTYIATFVSNLDHWLIDVVIANPLITAFDEIWGAMWYWFVYIANSMISVINAVILAFDAIPLGIGGIVVDFVSIIPEPYSAFLAPWAWLIVLAVMILMLVAALLVARFVVKTIKTAAEVGVGAA